jgi:hypothetical protein
LHVANAHWANAIDDELGVVERAKELAHERVVLPNLLEQRAIGHDLGDAGETDLVVSVVHVAELDLRVGGDLLGLVIQPQVGDIDRKAVGLDRRDGPQSRLIGIDGGQVREAVGCDNAQSQTANLSRVDRLGAGFGHELIMAGWKPAPLPTRQMGIAF